MAENGETTVIGADSHFKGELTFDKTAKIVGRFDGKISGKGDLNVVQNGQCQADVECSSFNIDGTIEGNVSAGDTVRLNANGTVRGDITAAKMVMAEGASFYGMCSVGPDAKKAGGNKPAGGPPAGGNNPNPTGGEKK